MQISRERFVDHFWPCVKVHALKMWTVRRKAPPTIVAGAMYDAMTVSAGNIPITRRRFSEILDPVICELHRTTPRTLAYDFPCSIRPTVRRLP